MSNLEPLCPCGSQQLLSACCARIWDGTPAATPEQLMRARYSAFALGRLEFLLATLHPSRHQPDELQQLQNSQAHTRWLKLHVLAAEGSTVEFVAFFIQHTKIGQLHERSRFVCEEQRWLYVDGDLLPPIKWQRNADCWCGEGKKYKKCHGAN